MQKIKAFLSKIKEFIKLKLSVKRNKILALSVLALAVLGGASYGGYCYYKSRNTYEYKPEAVVVEKKIEDIRTSISSVYGYEFNYDDKGNITPKNLYIRFFNSVANLEQIGKVIEKGAKITPQIKGVFKWSEDRVIEFVPEENYKLGIDYEIEFEDEIFKQGVKLSKNTIDFRLGGFFANTNYEFYEDPRDITIKKGIFIINFNYPVDKAVFEKALSVEISGRSSNKINYELSYENNDRRVIVITSPVKVLDEEQRIVLNARNISSVIVGDSKVDRIYSSIYIPSADNYFKLQNLSSDIIRNNQKNDEPEQILTLSFTSPAKVTDVKDNLKLSLVKGNYPSSEKINDVDFELIPTENDYSKTIMFKYDVRDENTYNKHLRVMLDRGITSQEGLKTGKSYENYEQVPQYPKELKIAFDGSVITSKASQNIPLISRGIDKIRVDISRISSDVINHLISQSNGDFKSPEFYGYRFSENNIAEKFNEEISLASKHPAKANYSSVNLEKYVADKKGIFLVKVRDNDYNNQDKRLILVSDIGMLVKNNKDESFDVFVSSIKDGEPLRNVTVDALSINGTPALSFRSDSDGHVKFPKLSNYIDEKEIVAFVARKGDDVSFIPYKSYETSVNYSKFNVGGIYSYNNENKVNAELFTDRGIYRPGENIKIGAVVRQENFAIPTDIPLEVYVVNPIGQEVYKKTINLPKEGIFDLSIDTTSTMTTGEYNAYIYTLKKNYSNDGYYREDFVASRSFKLEEFVPDRLKMAINLDKKQNKGWENEKELAFKVNLDNLFGSPATSRKVKSELALNPSDFRFKEYKDYYFKDPLKDENNVRNNVSKPLEELKTDANGEALIKVDLNEYEKGTYALGIGAEGFELDGGRGVSSSYQILVSPLRYLVGYKSDGNLYYISKDSVRKIDFIAINSDLEKIDLSDISLEIKELKFLSSLVKQPNGLYRYQTIKKETEVSKSDYTLSKDKDNVIDLNTKTVGDFALVLKDKRTDQIVARIEYSIAGSANLSYSLERNAELNVKLNKEEYKAGEEMEISINVPYTGYGLISIEDDSLKSYQWFNTDKQSTVQKIKLPKDISGNAYVNVSFVRSYEDKEIFMSPLSYAVVPFKVNRETRNLNIDLRVLNAEGVEKEKYEPGEDIKVMFKTSKKSKVIVYGVDEGILQVAKYKLPRPLATFFAKKALGVTTYQILDLIMPDFKFLKELSGIGGDESEFNKEALAKNLNPFARKVDKPVVFWSGVIDADENEKEFLFSVPSRFNGGMKIMAVASSLEEGRVGSTEKTIKVRGDFVALPNAPFVVAPFDEFDASVGVTNLIENSSANDFDVKIEVSDNLEVVGNAEQKLSIIKNLEKLAEFKVKAKEKLGNSEIRFLITADNGKVLKVKSTLSLRPVNTYKTILQSGFVKGAFEKENFLPKMYKEFREQTVSLSTSPFVFSSGLLKFLNKYPHGCTEQITSKVLPLIALGDNSPNAFDRNEAFKIIIGKYRLRQLSSGGFSTWDNGSYVSEFNSMYALHFLTYAKKKGYNVPKDMLNDGLRWIRSYLNSDDDNSMWNAKIKAYGIYILTLNEEVTTGFILNLTNSLDARYQDSWKKSIASSYLAASYKLLHEDKMANELIKGYNFDRDIKQDERHYYYYSDFDTSFVNDAIYVNLVNSHFSDIIDLNNDKTISRILNPIIDDDYSTLLSSYSVLALSSFNENKSNEFDLKAYDKEGKEIALEKSDKSMFVTYELPKNVYKISSSKSDLYYVITSQGFEQNIISEKSSEGVEVTKEFYVDGKKVTKVKKGDEVEVLIKVRALNDKENYNMAIIDLVVGGFEIKTESFSSDEIEHKDLREDRALVYLTVDENVKEVRYKVKATSKGKFTIPPVYLKSLYNKYVNAVYVKEPYFEVE